MGKSMNKIRILFWCILIAVSFCLGIAKGAGILQESTFRIILYLFFILVVVSALAVYTLWARGFLKKVNAIQPLIKSDPDRYIKEITELMDGIKSKQLISIKYINICAACCAKKDYLSAQKALAKVYPSKLRGFNRAVYAADMAYVLFYLGENDKAADVMETYRKQFSQLSENRQIGGIISTLNIFEKTAEGKWNEAEALLETAKSKWLGSDTEDDLTYLETLIAEHTG
ncbi:hypothetical protein MUJ63_01095 [Lachnospiraceae bacterium NSJ-143]|nr:hypothetical protein [Lachnospiraceae bacterium NSJ-143]